jgi:hypothetical protein
MMDKDGYFQYRMEHYQSLVSEAEKARLLQELGVTQMDVLRSVAADFQEWLSRIIGAKIASVKGSDETPARNVEDDMVTESTKAI